MYMFILNKYPFTSGTHTDEVPAVRLFSLFVFVP